MLPHDCNPYFSITCEYAVDLPLLQAAVGVSVWLEHKIGPAGQVYAYNCIQEP